jgi:hypothetical protein
MLTALCISEISAAAIMFFSHRLLCYLWHFQEGGYCPRQFKDWVVANGIYDKKGSLVATIAALMLELTEGNQVITLVICTIAAAALVWLGFWEKDLRTFGTLRVQSTKQAKAIYNLALSLYSLVFISCIITIYLIGANDDIACYWLLVIIAIQSSPIWVLLASNLLRPLS